jgi:hypothetical protein
MMKIAFWLIPAEPDRTIYQSLIRDFAHRYNAPTFAPHVTLHSCKVETLHAFQSVIDIVLEFDQISYSDSFTKSLFIQFLSNSQLDQLSESFRQKIESPFILNPHLSLIYANLPESEKRSLIPEIPVKPSIRFDQIRAIEIPTSIQTREDVEKFRPIH